MRAADSGIFFTGVVSRLNSRARVAAQDVALGLLVQERQVVDRARQVEVPVRIVRRPDAAGSRR